MVKISEKTIFEYNHYRDYLEDRLSTQGTTRGLRSQLARVLDTKPAFITQVIRGKNSLSPEHIPLTNHFFKHSTDESHFFTLLVLHGRAGNNSLKDYYQDQISEIKKQRTDYFNRIKGSEKLSSSNQSIYYSQWYFVAIHVLTSIPEYQSRQIISERLKLPLPIVTAALNTLVELGLVQNKSGRYIMSEKRVYLKNDSPWINQMHVNHRNRAVSSLSAPEKDDFHLSQSMSLSFQDYHELKKKIMDLLSEFEPSIASSKEEEAFILNVDLFKLI